MLLSCMMPHSTRKTTLDILEMATNIITLKPKVAVAPGLSRAGKCRFYYFSSMVATLDKSSATREGGCDPPISHIRLDPTG